LFPEERNFEASSGLFLDEKLLLWKEYIVPGIQNAPS
jgi:hypothetical protein